MWALSLEKGSRPLSHVTESTASPSASRLSVSCGPAMGLASHTSARPMILEPVSGTVR
jgi:hypothetical protein